MIKFRLKFITMNKILIVVLFLSAFFTCDAQQLIVSEADSKVRFTIKNMRINVDGTLKGLKGKMHFDPKNITTSAFDVTVDVNTINTENAKRDAHLKKEDFFDAAKYPTIRIVTSQIVSKGGDSYKAVGTLTIKNVSKKIGFDFTATPAASGYEFKSSFTINRRDFSVGGNSMMMGDIVTVNLGVSGRR